MNSAPGAPATVGVVLIARNEGAHIAACIESVLTATAALGNVPIVLVDSDSTDDTVTIAARYPLRICRYRGPVRTAAAGRRIGFENIRARYVLFLDGDCCVEPAWVRLALGVLEQEARPGIVYGARSERFAGDQEARNYGPAAEEYGLGGNAMYAADALRGVGGFNPYLAGEEEAELAARIVHAGFAVRRTAELMVTHFTEPKSSLAEFRRRSNAGLLRGAGQVLRLSLRQGLFWHHARRFNRYLLTLAYLALGLVLAVTALVVRRPGLPLGWLALGLAGFMALAVKRGSLRGAAYIVADWVAVSIGLVRGFLSAPRRPEDFSPPTDWIR